MQPSLLAMGQQRGGQQLLGVAQVCGLGRDPTPQHTPEFNYPHEHSCLCVGPMGLPQLSLRALGLPKPVFWASYPEDSTSTISTACNWKFNLAQDNVHHLPQVQTIQQG